MMSATSANSASPNPRVASAGVPIRSPDVTIGGRGSIGTALRFTVMPDLVQEVLGLLAVELAVAQVDEHEVHVGAAREHADAGGRDIRLREPLGDEVCAIEHALLALLELRRRGELERDRLRGDHVHERAALLAGEDGGVDLLGEVGVVGEDEARRAVRRGSCARWR